VVLEENIMKSIFFSKNLKKPKHYVSAKPKTDVIAIIKMDILIKCQLIWRNQSDDITGGLLLH
jgi:hypothetical protein